MTLRRRYNPKKKPFMILKPALKKNIEVYAGATLYYMLY
jgi:hypothetical protein